MSDVFPRLLIAVSQEGYRGEIRTDDKISTYPCHCMGGYPYAVGVWPLGDLNRLQSLSPEVWAFHRYFTEHIPAEILSAASS